MIKPKIKYELEVAYGTVYGLEEAAALMECLKNMAPSCGKKVKQFEDEFASYCGTGYALAVTSATTGPDAGWDGRGNKARRRGNNHPCQLDIDFHGVFSPGAQILYFATSTPVR